MKSIYRILLVLGLLFIGGCATLTQPPEAPRVTLSNLKVVEAQLFEQRYALTLRVQNPNNQDLNISGLSFKVELNGKEFAEGVSREAISLPAFGEATVDIDVTSSLLQIFDQLKSLNKQKGEPLNYRIYGKLGLANSLLNLPFERKGELRLGANR